MDTIPLPTSPSRRGSEFPLTSLSPTKRPNLLLLETQLAVVNNHINSLSRSFVGFAGEEDISSWLRLFSVILRDTTDALAKVDIKASFIPYQPLTKAEELVRQLNHEEVQQWNKAVRTGLIDGDWADLIEHRTCHFALDRQTAFKYCDSESEETK